MKTYMMRWALTGLVALTLAACSSSGSGKGTTAAGGGSSGSGNLLTIKSTTPAGQVSKVVATGVNTVFSAHTNSTDNKTVIQICADLDRDNDCSKMLLMTIDGESAQKYTMDSVESLSQIVYHDDEPEVGVVNHYISNKGEIEIQSIDPAGSVQGVFTAELECNSGCTGTVNVSGNFNIALNK